MLDGVTLDQLRMLIAIADSGSFTAAAAKVQRAQSAVSHAITSLETQLGLELFDRSSRKPELTANGKAVVADARLTIARADALRARARGLAQGLEPEVGLAVTVLAPMASLLDLCDRFRAEFPSVGLELFVEEIGGSAIHVHERVCAIGIAGSPSLAMVPVGDLVTIPIGEIEIVAVAAPDHLLARLDRPINEQDLNESRQLVPTSRARQPYPNTIVREVWRVADLATRREMILRGMGWGTVPRHVVEADIEAGRLVVLAIPTRAREAMRVPLFAIHRLDTALGPAARWLVESMTTTFTPTG